MYRLWLSIIYMLCLVLQLNFAMSCDSHVTDLSYYHFSRETFISLHMPRKFQKKAEPHNTHLSAFSQVGACTIESNNSSLQFFENSTNKTARDYIMFSLWNLYHWNILKEP